MGPHSDNALLNGDSQLFQGLLSLLARHFRLGNLYRRECEKIKKKLIAALVKCQHGGKHTFSSHVSLRLCISFSLACIWSWRSALETVRISPSFVW